ncbi:MAG: hypothetical protein K9L22_00870 [Methylococcaceae bacterium]|nr:hypothetical protein [Methylococcaceae bacterium]
MKMHHKNTIVASSILAILMHVNTAQADLQCEADALFDWAEITLPELFPSSAVTQTLAPWLYRHYPKTNIYAGVSDDQNVYLLGGNFGNEPFYIDTLHNLLGLANIDMTCPITFKAVTLPAANNNMSPPNGSYLGLTPILHFVNKDIVMAVYNHPQYIDGGKIFRSEDGGINWELIASNLASIQAFAFVDELTGYVVGSASSYGVNQYVGKTFDGGKTWVDITSNLGQWVNEIWAGIPRNTLNYNVIAPDEKTVFIAGRHTVYGSFDGGESWILAGGSKTRDEGAKSYLHYTTLGFIDGRAYIATYDHLEYYSAETTTNPEWVALDAPWNYEAGLQLKNLTFSSANKGWALVEDVAAKMIYLYQTHNGGNNWLKIAESTKNDDTTLFPRNTNITQHKDVLFATAKFGTRHHVITSSDGGKTWAKNEWYGSNGWPLFIKVVDDKVRVYINLNGDFNLRSYGID